jgi:hypothetical protein
MRVNVKLDDDAYTFATIYARARGLRLGVAISELLRRAEQAPPISQSHLLTRNRHGLLVRAKDGRRTTPAMVKKYSEDDPSQPFLYRLSSRISCP